MIQLQNQSNDRAGLQLSKMANRVTIRAAYRMSLIHVKGVVALRGSASLPLPKWIK